VIYVTPITAAGRGFCSAGVAPAILGLMSHYKTAGGTTGLQNPRKQVTIEQNPKFRLHLR